MTSRARNTATRLRKSADKLDKLWKDCKIAHACGTTAGLVGGLLTIGGGVATMMSAGIAAPLLLLGVGVGAGGAVTNLGTSIVEASINSTEIKRAEKDLKESFDCKSAVNNTTQLWLDRKEKARLLYNGFLLVRAMELSDTVKKIEQELGLHFANITEAGALAASDVAQSSIRAGSKLAGGLIIGISAAFLMWDAKDLRSTITDLRLGDNQGSEVAKLLRQKANELDNIN